MKFIKLLCSLYLGISNSDYLAFYLFMHISMFYPRGGGGWRYSGDKTNKTITSLGNLTKRTGRSIPLIEILEEFIYVQILRHVQGIFDTNL